MSRYPVGSSGGRIPAYVERAMDEAHERGWEYGEYDRAEYQPRLTQGELQKLAMEECESIIEELGDNLYIHRSRDWRIRAVLDAWIEGYNEGFEYYESVEDSISHEDEL